MSEVEPKQFVCKVCTAKFNIYSSYYSHVRTKHSDPKIQCPHCEVRFTTIASRNAHYFRAKEAKEEDEIVRTEIVVEKPIKKKRKFRRAEELSLAEESSESSADQQLE